MQTSSNIRSASSLATQLSALSGRPVVVREQPAVVVNNRPFLLGRDRRDALLRAAVARFNAS